VLAGCCAAARLHAIDLMSIKAGWKSAGQPPFFTGASPEALRQPVRIAKPLFHYRIL
jgi:hypothetical protein